MEIKKYWWEEEIERLLKEWHENEYLSDSDIKLFIRKIIETELQKHLSEEKDRNLWADIHPSSQ